MALCGLLFYVDTQLKQWTKYYVFLSRFSFAIYGSSILTLLLSANTLPARLITLLLAIGVYSMVVWQSLTLPPLYLLLGCLSWLYSLTRGSGDGHAVQMMGLAFYGLQFAPAQLLGGSSETAGEIDPATNRGCTR